jgi:hypothetical protein
MHPAKSYWGVDTDLLAGVALAAGVPVLAAAAGAGAAAVCTGNDFGMGTQGCSGATSPGNTGGAAFRISPVGQGCRSITGRRLTGVGGG